MNGNSPIWWVLGALILLAIIGFAISAMGKSRTDARRHEASAIRDDSVEQEREMRVGISRSGCVRPIVSTRMSRRTSTATALAGPQLGRVPVRALEPLLVSLRVPLSPTTAEPAVAGATSTTTTKPWSPAVTATMLTPPALTHRGPPRLTARPRVEGRPLP